MSPALQYLCVPPHVTGARRLNKVLLWCTSKISEKEPNTALVSACNQTVTRDARTGRAATNQRKTSVVRFEE